MGGEQTRARVIDTAERLIAERGVEAVSLRQIARAAGERNHAVVQYHFGTKSDLIDAILTARASHVDLRRRAMVDELHATNRTADLHAIIEAMIYPLAELLGVPGPGGDTYILFLLEVLGARSRKLLLTTANPAAVGMVQLEELARGCLPHLPRLVARERENLMIGHVLYALADHVRRTRRGEDSATGAIPTAAFVSNLVDTVVAALSAPVSQHTRRQLEQAAARSA